MGRIIAIANQKGGVGKTTTAVNLSAALAAAGKKTLIIDMDPQGNTTTGLGLDKNELEHTIYEVISDEISFNDVFVPMFLKTCHWLQQTVILRARRLN